MRPENPDHVDPRETPPETSHCPRCRSHDLIESQEAFVVRERYQINFAREQEALVRVRTRSGSTEEEGRVEFASYRTRKRKEREIGWIGRNARTVARLDQNEGTVVVDPEIPRRGSHGMRPGTCSISVRAIVLRIISSSHDYTQRECAACAGWCR